MHKISVIELNPGKNHLMLTLSKSVRIIFIIITAILLR